MTGLARAVRRAGDSFLWGLPFSRVATARLFYSVILSDDEGSLESFVHGDARGCRKGVREWQDNRDPSSSLRMTEKKKGGPKSPQPRRKSRPLAPPCPPRNVQSTRDATSRNHPHRGAPARVSSNPNKNAGCES